MSSRKDKAMEERWHELVAIARRYLSKEDAEDVVQEVYLQRYERNADWDLAAMCRRVRTRALRLARKQARLVELTNVHPAPALDAPEERAMAMVVLRDIVLEFPDVVLVLCDPGPRARKRLERIRRKLSQKCPLGDV